MLPNQLLEVGYSQDSFVLLFIFSFDYTLMRIQKEKRISGTDAWSSILKPNMAPQVLRPKMLVVESVVASLMCSNTLT